MCIGEVERGRQGGGMAEEGTKREGTELFGLPPRKRFKVMEQQRRKEIEEESAEVDSHCNDITNVMPPHRVSPKKLTSQGFLVLEKQKYKLQQQKLQENLVPAMPPLPPRPVAVKRKEAPALPLPALPTMRLKFQGEKVHSPSSSAFKSWGGPSPKKIFKSQASPVLPKSSGSPREPRKDPGHRPKRHQQERLSAPSSVEHPKTWTMAKGTSCSINKAQEDVEMMVCEAPVWSSDMCSSDGDVIVSTKTTSSVPLEALSLNVAAGGDNGSQIASDDNAVEASRVFEVEMMTATVPSDSMEDVMHEVQDAEDVAADLGSSLPLDDIHVADDSQSPPGDMTTVNEAVYVDVPQANGDGEIVGNTKQMCSTRSLLPMDGPTLEIPVDKTGLSEAGESRVVHASEILEVEPEAHADDATPGVPEACSSQFLSPLTAGSSIVALVESRTDSETLNTSKVSEDLSVAANCKENNTLSNQCEKVDDETCSARKDEEQAAQVVADEVEVREDKERVAVTAEERDEQERDMKEGELLAEIDERAEKIFKRMFEREGCTGCDDEEDGSDSCSSQFFFASNGVNNFNSLLIGMEVDGGPSSNSQDLDEASTPEQKNGDGRGVEVLSSDEDHKIDLGRPTVKIPIKPPEEMTSEMPERSCRASEGHEGSVCSDDLETDSPIPAGLGHGSIRSQEIVCKSSTEDSDWDLEMEIPNFSFGKRSGITQRVKAPGRWSQSSEAKAINLDKEADEGAGEDEDEGACDVCRSADAKPSDPIVYCDGCDIPVHADCYGNPLSHEVPEGDWFCAQCQSKRPDSRRCCLCPRSGGVMKMTTDGKWAHLSCAVFVPEVFFRQADNMEGIDTSHVPSKRYLSKCCVCKSTGGACVDCTEIDCKSRFHVSCALKEDLAMEFRNGRGGAIVISFCQEHTAAWDEQQERKGRSKYKIVSREPQKTKVSQRSRSR